MPEISRFLGVVIAMYYNDHAPPHFHAKYGQQEIVVHLDDGSVDGDFPPRARKLVLEWFELHRDELLENWMRARQRLPLLTIVPLE